MIQYINIENFLNTEQDRILIDVRTPAEYEHAHIPNAVNMPIFSNEERVQIGTTYKQIGKEEATILGFEYAGPKWSNYIKSAKLLAPHKKVCVHCWRGGMRSGAIAWCLDFAGFDVLVITGGYKSYRNWVLEQFKKEYPLLVLGGMTGSHKTDLINNIEQIGEQIVDLEKLAQHQGSAFGSMNKLIQPSQEQFENLLATKLATLQNNKKIWIEDESYSIGKIVIPRNLWLQMQCANMIEIQIDKVSRIDYLANEYGKLNIDFLKNACLHIQKRLGFDNFKKAIQALDNNEVRTFIEIIIYYYDKCYQKCINKRNPEKVFTFPITTFDIKTTSQQLINFSNTF